MTAPKPTLPPIVRIPMKLRIKVRSPSTVLSNPFQSYLSNFDQQATVYCTVPYWYHTGTNLFRIPCERRGLVMRAITGNANHRFITHHGSSSRKIQSEDTLQFAVRAHQCADTVPNPSHRFRAKFRRFTTAAYQNIKRLHKLCVLHDVRLTRHTR